MNKRIVFSGHSTVFGDSLESGNTSANKNKVYIPIKRDLVTTLEKEIDSIKSLKDLFSRLKWDFGLLTLVFEIQKVKEKLAEEKKITDIAFDREDIENFIRSIKSKNFFCEENLSALQWSCVKINSILTGLAFRAQSADIFKLIRLSLPMIYFSFYTPSWFEKVIKKSQGNFEELLFRCYESGPLKPSEIEEFFFDFSIGGSILESYAENRDYLQLASSSEPSIFYVTASNISTILSSKNLKNAGINSVVFEEIIQQWINTWRTIVPPMLTNVQTVEEILRLAKTVKGKRHLDTMLPKLKIFELENDIFEIFFGELVEGYPSVEAIRILFSEILPKCGYNYAVTMLLNESRNALIPKLKIGKAKSFFIPTIFLNSPRKEELPVVTAVVEGKIQKIEQDSFFGAEGNFFIVPLNFEKHSGVLILGTDLDDRSSISIESFKKAERFAELLGMALGYQI